MHDRVTGLSRPFPKLTVSVPPSKSHTMRALVFALMARGRCVVRNTLPSPDTEAMIKAIEQLGATVDRFEDRLEIVGTGGEFTQVDGVIDAGNSGQVLRFVGALAALSGHHVVITGDASTRKLRPVGPLLEGLTQLGAHAQAMRIDGRAPYSIQGPIKSGSITISGEDSQPVSALLMAVSFLPGPTEIEVIQPGETPWINLTLHWLHRFGIDVKHDNFRRYTVAGGVRIEPFDCTIPGDFSSAAYPIVAALITGSELTLRGLDLRDVQGDKKVIDILQSMGANILRDEIEQTITVKKSTLVGKKSDVNEVIDALPLLAVLGCFAAGQTELTGGGIARFKESDRIGAITAELKKMGAHIEETEDGVVVSTSSLKGTTLNSHHDHRIALSLAVAALGAEGATTIEDSGCINKSYPTFFEHLKQMGGAP